jgi:hypothetical protein
MRQLSSIYDNGTLLSKNQSKATEWQRKYEEINARLEGQKFKLPETCKNILQIPLNSPQNWPKPWPTDVNLAVGSNNPKDDVPAGGHTNGTSANFIKNKIDKENNVLSEDDPKYSLDMLPPTGYDPKVNPIKIFAPASGTIRRVNTDPRCPSSCLTGSGTYGNHIIVDTYDGETYLIAHLDSFNLTREFKVYFPDEPNDSNDSARVAEGEFIGVLGNSKNVQYQGSPNNIIISSRWSEHHLHFEVASRSFKDPMGLFGINKNDFKNNDTYTGDIQDTYMVSANKVTNQQPNVNSVKTSKDLLPGMSDNDAKLLNIFFSNFSETTFPLIYGNPEIKKDDYLIAFGIENSYYNKPYSHKKIENKYGSCINTQAVTDSVFRYFGEKLHNHHSVPNSDIFPIGYNYIYGCYYVEIGDGEPRHWSQVLNFYELGNGTFRAVIQNYFSHCYFDNIYDRIQYWKLDGCILSDKRMEENHVSPGQQWTATVASHEYNGKATYKMISMSESN